MSVTGYSITDTNIEGTPSMYAATLEEYKSNIRELSIDQITALAEAELEDIDTKILNGDMSSITMDLILKFHCTYKYLMEHYSMVTNMHIVLREDDDSVLTVLYKYFHERVDFVKLINTIKCKGAHHD